MSHSGVDISVNLPVLTRPHQFASITAFAKELNEREYMGGRIISFTGIHPDDDAVEERLAFAKSEGFLGIKIHPDYQNTFFDDPKYLKILECAKSLDLITVTHAGLDGAYVGQPIKCTPERVLRALDKIGGYDKLVLAHLGGNQLWHEVYEKLAGEKIYFDTSYVLKYVDEDLFKKILDKHGDERILFATDNPWSDALSDVNIIKGYKLGSDTEDKILSANAKKLLGI